MSSFNGLKLVGLGMSAALAGLAFTGGCSSSSDNARLGGAGTGTAGTSSGAGETSTGGGSTGTAGAASGGTGTAGAGTTAGTGGAATSGVDVCGLPTTTAANPLLYDGVTTAPNCNSAIATPRAGYWFHYGDSTVGATQTAAGAFGGCAGAADCAFHTTGMGYTDYGAGIGFDLNDDSAQTAQPYDATPYMGLQFWAKGTITGTRGPKYAQMDQEIHIKLVTATDRSGDDFGGYCVIGADWTKCSLSFADATRDGFSKTPDPTTDVLDANMMLKIQLEFSKFSQDADAGVTIVPVAYDVFVDDVSFF
jgi:hypothetical protein